MSDDTAPVPVTVIAGFLGAGKTTLLGAWLRARPPGEVAVIVNELGEVGIDGELLSERARVLVEIAGGCVCCATQGELVSALGALASRAPRPGRIVVETSGAASPAGVLRAIVRGAASVRLDGIVTVVDAQRLGRIAQHDLAAEQIGYADVLVLSRADACGGAELDAARAELARRNPMAAIATASRGAISGSASLDDLLARRGGDLAIVPHAAHDRGIESLALVVPGELDEERFGDWVETELARFEGRLLRMKGILAIAGIEERAVLQGVADAFEIELGAPWGDAPRTSRLVLIGFGLDREALQAGFRACAIG